MKLSKLFFITFLTMVFLLSVCILGYAIASISFAIYPTNGGYDPYFQEPMVRCVTKVSIGLSIMFFVATLVSLLVESKKK